jgi:retron-type reverse transcriptase
VRKFFDSIHHDILYDLITKKIEDYKILSLVHQILASFSKTDGVGLPLGNVTSQLFANIYLNGLDQFIKHNLKAKYYARYCDDFVIVDPNEQKLKDYISQIREFLQVRLKLDLHPNKISIRKVSQGVDFLGFVSMLKHSLLRTKTKNRIFKKISQMVEKGNREKLLLSLPSYLGILKHVQGQKIEETIFQNIESIFTEETKRYEYMYSVINEFKKYDIIRANS